MEGVVNVNDFVKLLERKGLVIARRDMVLPQEALEEQVLQMKQEKLLNRKWLTPSEIINGQLLKYRSRTGLMIALSKRADYDQIVKKIRGKTRVLTSVIKKMRDE